MKSFVLALLAAKVSCADPPTLKFCTGPSDTTTCGTANTSCCGYVTDVALKTGDDPSIKKPNMSICNGPLYADGKTSSAVDMAFA